MKKENVLKQLLVLGIASSPLYLFDSGGMQISHLLLLFFAMAHLIKDRVVIRPYEYGLLALIGYSLIVEILYSLSGKYDLQLIHPVFLIYNAILLVAVRRFVDVYSAGFLRGAILISTTLCVLGVIIESGGARSQGFYNNPNQLGYFSVLLCSFAVFIFVEKAISFSGCFFLLVVAVVLSVLSLSKAAMISTWVVMNFWLFSGVRKNTWASVLTAMAIILIMASFLTSPTATEYSFVVRLLGLAEEEDSTLAARGYAVMSNVSWWQYFLGLGTQNVYEIVGHEIHSTFGSVWGSYGLVGLLLFSWFSLSWLRISITKYGWAYGLCIAMGPLLYGLTHNGIRFSLFWVLVACVASTYSTSPRLEKSK